MRFYLGTHEASWLNWLGVPLFVSDRRLRRYRQRLPVAAAPWALDSGGFTELSEYGSWDHGPSPAEYVDRVRRYQCEIGQLTWAAPQDWMCEPSIVTKTGLSVLDHQWRTVENWLDLTALAPDLPFVPVVQGQGVADYVRHVGLYRAAGVDLAALPLVGVGSVCRRQGTSEVVEIFETLHEAGLHGLHGFGLKKLGLARSGHLLASSDSMAWSFRARRHPPLPECRHQRCQNCPRYALQWRTQVVELIEHV